MSPLYIWIIYHALLIFASHGPGILASGWKNWAYTIHPAQYAPSAKRGSKKGEPKVPVDKNPMV